MKVKPASPRQNVFALVRWGAALLIVAFHCFVLTNHPQAHLFRPADAVHAFFVMSGFFSALAVGRRPRPLGYYAHRARRLVPPYAVVVAACVVVGALLSSWPLDQYIKSAETWRYLLANLSFLNFLQPTLPGVFAEGNHVVTAVNGALWTMKMEVMFALVVPVLYAMHQSERLGSLRHFLSLILTVGCFVGATYAERKLVIGFPLHIMKQWVFFYAGFCASLYAERLSEHRRVIITGAIVFFVVAQYVFSLYYVLVPCAMAALLSLLGPCRLPAKTPLLPPITFELYLVHFPIVQILIVLLPSLRQHVGLLLLMVLLLSLGVAMMLHRATRMETKMS